MLATSGMVIPIDVIQVCMRWFSAVKDRVNLAAWMRS